MRRWYVWVTVSVALFGLLIWRTRPWDALSTGAEWRLLAIVIGLNIVVIGAWAVRSARLMAAVGHALPVIAMVPIVSFANTINNLTPASTGEAVRAVILRRRHDVAYGRSTAVIIAERLWAIWIMAVTAGAAAVGTIVPASPAVVTATWIAAIAAVFAPSIAYARGLRPAAFVARRVDGNAHPAGTDELGTAAEPAAGAGTDIPGASVDPEGDRRPRRARLATLLRDVDANLAGILARPSIAVPFVLSTGVVFATTAIQLWLVLLALGEEISVVAAWAALGLATIAGVVSALPFGLGAADVVMTALLTTLGVPPSTAGAASLLVRATVTLPLGIAGTASWIVLSREARPSAEGSTQT
ncbi:MAG TPA: lysylphosphatidylglycerol synthase transmembrane domain-containing protein [Candidatus Limnocylindrales bacterium]|nr:lysylphosphatidylglycerol synthase transmembrane domain-containing protein [Candidatus Limnocylindrales bacterium]